MLQLLDLDAERGDLVRHTGDCYHTTLLFARLLSLPDSDVLRVLTLAMPEEIVAKLRQVDVLTSQVSSVADAIRQIGISEVTYYRWRQQYGGLKS